MKTKKQLSSVSSVDAFVIYPKPNVIVSQQIKKKINDKTASFQPISRFDLGQTSALYFSPLHSYTMGRRKPILATEAEVFFFQGYPSISLIKPVLFRIHNFFLHIKSKNLTNYVHLLLFYSVNFSIRNTINLQTEEKKVDGGSEFTIKEKQRGKQMRERTRYELMKRKRRQVQIFQGFIE